MSEIPAELLPLISEFRYPTGCTLRRMIASDYNLEGWVVQMGITGMYLYSDGEVAGRPRHRAYQEMNAACGEDDFRSDADWQKAEELEEKYSRMLIHPLDDAHALARKHGAANRHVRQGETVTIRRLNTQATVINPGTEHDRGERVIVETADGRRQPWHLHALQLHDA